ncbi:4-hydroxyphenylacetate 3-hydroxylase family protein [Zavarzinia sp. CC-PAN008]|uniref:4-hydroxyphenylacetate 3-hydroxylase family protein n=1 Tax=Zavarzinia sp. CC-PAN008 TaxID=3243332 RepID=UPI003F74A211
MGLMTGADYRASLADGRKVWLDGARVANVASHPAFSPMVDAVAAIYDLHHDPVHAEAMTFALPDGARGSRFYKIPESRRDLELRRQMTSTILERIGPTMDRFGDETVSPLFVVQDRKAWFDRFDPRYAAAAAHWLDRLQRENLFLTSGNTDPKGDRSKQPFEQKDPDLWLRVVRETDAGIVIRGAKFETGAPYAHVAFVKPTVGAWIEANRDYAVACIVELNAPGVRHLCRAPLTAGGAAQADPFEYPLTARYDEIDTLIVFDDVLVPWENVIFSRTPELAAMIRSEFARWAAHGFLTRCLAKAELLVGAALLCAEQAGTLGIPAVRTKVTELMSFHKTIQAFLHASEAACETTESGFVMPNQAIQNAGRIYCTQTYGQAVTTLRDIAGGQAVMLPSRAMLDNPEIGADIAKYFAAGAFGAEERLRTLHLVRDLTASAYAGRAQAYQMFAETPVFAQQAALYATYDRDRARALAQSLCQPADERAADGVWEAAE